MEQKILFFALAVLVFSFALVQAQTTADPTWLLFRHDGLHTASPPLAGLDKASIKWKFSSGGAVWSSPAFDKNVLFNTSATLQDAIFIGFENGAEGGLYAINADTGGKIWEHSKATSVRGTVGKTRTSPAILKGIDVTLKNGTAVAGDDIIYFGSSQDANGNGRMYALREKTGEEVWSYVLAVNYSASPIVDRNVSFTKGNNVNLNPVGKVEWRPGIFFGTSSGYNFYALDAQDSGMKWIFTAGGLRYSSPALDKNATFLLDVTANPQIGLLVKGNAVAAIDTGGKNYLLYTNASTLYVGNDDKNIYALDEGSGTNTWRYQTAGKVRSSPMVAKGIVYTYTNLSGSSDTINASLIVVGSDDKSVYALSERDGLKVWSFQTGDVVRSSAASAVIDGEKSIIIGSDDGNVYALKSSDGTQKWSASIGGKVRGSPVISNDGKIAITSCNGRLYLLNASDGAVLQKHRLNYSGGCGDDDDFFSSPTLGTWLFSGSPDGRVIAFQNKAPDLAVTKILFSKESTNVSEPINITIILNNTGDFQAEATDLTLSVNQSSQNFSVPTLAEAGSANYSWQYNFSSAGNYSICGLADAKDSVDESSESNNEKCISFSVGLSVAVANATTTTLVSGDGADSVKPQISEMSISPENPKENQIVIISGTATDNKNLASASLQFLESGTWVEKSTRAISGASNTFRFDIPTSGALGSKITWRVVVKDSAGNSFESAEKFFTVGPSACMAAKPEAYNKTQCTSGNLTHVDFACNEASGVWEAKESQMQCGGAPPATDMTLLFALIVVLLVLGAGVLFLLKKKKDIVKEEPPQQEPQYPQEEGGEEEGQQQY